MGMTFKKSDLTKLIQEEVGKFKKSLVLKEELAKIEKQLNGELMPGVWVLIIVGAVVD